MTTGLLTSRLCYAIGVPPTLDLATAHEGMAAVRNTGADQSAQAGPQVTGTDGDHQNADQAADQGVGQVGL